jgi:hypothetical protein
MRRGLTSAVLGLALAAASSPAPSAHPTVSAGIGALRFRDARLRAAYPESPIVRARVELARVGGVPLVAAGGVSWSGGHAANLGFVEASKLRMSFLPIALQAPIRVSLGDAALRLGPEVAWAWYRESWEARIPLAGLVASGRADGSWIGAGVVLEVCSAVRDWGSFRAGYEGLWAKARRQTARGNREREEEMQGGWDVLYVEWSPPIAGSR